MRSMSFYSCLCISNFLCFGFLELTLIAMAFQLFLPPSVLHRIGAFLPYDQLHIYGEGHGITPFYNPLGFLYNRADWQAQVLAQLAREWLARNHLPMLPYKAPSPKPPPPKPTQYWPIDLDMMFCRLQTHSLPGNPMLDYHLLQLPVLDVLPERPQEVIQPCPSPLAIYVDIPPPYTKQGWKEALCNAFYMAGVGQPVPTPPDLHSMTTGIVKVPGISSSWCLKGLVCLKCGVGGMG